MKTLIITFLFSSIILNSFSQKLTRDKETCLSSISQQGYKYAQHSKNPSVYWYKKYDEFGDCLVQLTFEGNVLRKVVIGHKDSKSNLDRFRDLFKQVTQEETMNFDWTNEGNGYGKAYNTSYYSGNARYECDTKKYYFVIIPIN